MIVFLYGISQISIHLFFVQRLPQWAHGPRAPLKAVVGPSSFGQYCLFSLFIDLCIIYALQFYD